LFAWKIEHYFYGSFGWTSEVSLFTLENGIFGKHYINSYSGGKIKHSGIILHLIDGIGQMRII
jgi:hypothetical protein